MASRIATTFSEHLEHIGLQMPYCQGSDAANMLANYKNIFQELIMGGPGCINSSDCNAMMKDLVVNTHLDCGMKHDLSRMIRSRMSSDQHKGKCQKAENQQLQSCNRIEDFFTSKFWSMAGDPKVGYLSLMLEMKKQCWSLGLTNPNEKTWVSLAAILLMSKMDKNLWEKAMYNGKALNIVKELKSKIRPQRGLRKYEHWGTIVLFPASPYDLKHEYPNIFEEAYPDIANIPSNAPTDCPLDHLMLAQLRSMMPARGSRYMTSKEIILGRGVSRSEWSGGGHCQDEAEETLPGSLTLAGD